MMSNQVTVQKTQQVANETGTRETPVSKDLVVFPIPNGFVPPNGVQPGQSFDAVCRVNFQKGQMTLEAIEGHEVRLASSVAKTPKINKDASFENAVEQGLSKDETGENAGMA
jgi:hypothetical protein